ncbi:MAG: apolipoprotein N-acyltransferase [Verrucomicrobiota bacterium]
MKLSLVKGLWLALLSGLLVGLGYRIIPAWWICVSLIPLLIPCFRGRFRYRQVFFFGWLTQFVAGVINYMWLAEGAANYYQIHIIAAVPVAVCYAAVGLLQIPLGCLLTCFVWRRWKPSVLLVVLCFACSCWLLESLLPSLLPNSLGYSFFFSELPAYQLADWVGFSGLSFLIYLINALFVWALVNDRFQLLLSGSRLAVPVLLLVAINLVGYLHGRAYKQTGEGREVSLLLVQPYEQLRLDEALSLELPTRVIQGLTEFTREQYEGYLMVPNLTIWPELAFPLEVNVDPFSIPQSESIEALIQDYQAPLLFGTSVSGLGSKVSGREKRGVSHNAAVLLDENAEFGGVYEKEVLFPFVEAHPFAHYLPEWLYQALPEKRLAAGYNEVLLRVGDLRLGTLICYEGTLTESVLWQVSAGANLLVSISNDSWFSQTAGAEIHHLITMARAIEYRLPLVRVSQSGISGLILRNGAITALSEQNVSWAERVKLFVENEPELTFYARFPNLLLILVSSGYLSLILYAFLNKLK